MTLQGVYEPSQWEWVRTQVDLSGLMRVLGNNLYSTPHVALRELVQNAHDSCVRRQLEDMTDRLASGPVDRLGQTGVERVIDLATPLSRHLVDSGLVPVPNPIGAPRP